LKGDQADDILAGDTSVFDSDREHEPSGATEAMLAILDEWTSDRSFPDRVANINGQDPSDDRLNEDFFLKLGETVLNDGQPDELSGGPGDDWLLLSDNDRAKGQQDDEDDDGDDD
jgi:hypothetical protein